MRTPIILAALVCCTAPVMAQDTAPTVLDTLNEMQEESVPSIADVQSLFDQLYRVACPQVEDGYQEDPQSFDIRFRYESDDATQPDRLFTLYQFFCYPGAYNAAYVYFGWDAFEGLKPVGLVTPNLAVDYEGDEAAGTYDDTKVTSLAITGYVSRVVLLNPSFDPATNTISSYSHWRGLGDASSGGTWVFSQGEFVLRDYFVDATYDGEINPKTILDFRKPQLVK